MLIEPPLSSVVVPVNEVHILYETYKAVISQEENN